MVEQLSRVLSSENEVVAASYLVSMCQVGVLLLSLAALPVLHQDLQRWEEVADADGSHGLVYGAISKQHLPELGPLGLGKDEAQLFAVLKKKIRRHWKRVRKSCFSLPGSLRSRWHSRCITFFVCDIGSSTQNLRTHSDTFCHFFPRHLSARIKGLGQAKICTWHQISLKPPVTRGFFLSGNTV